MAEKTKYTHLAKFYGIPCYFNNETQELDGRNSFYSILLDVAVWIEKEFPSNPHGFPIQITGEIK